MASLRSLWGDMGMVFRQIKSSFLVFAAVAAVAVVPAPNLSDDRNTSPPKRTSAPTEKEASALQDKSHALTQVSDTSGDTEKIVDETKAHQEQQLAVLEIEKLGGKVYYDYQRGKRPNEIDPKATPTDPKRLAWVFHVSLRDTKVTNEDLRHLRKLPQLQTLDLSNTSITSRGMVHLKGAKHLACLSLWNTKVGDEGLRFLRDKKDLFNLTLDGTQITDSGLEHLSQLTNLEEWLGLVDTNVTDQGLRHLKALKKLQSLNLRRTRVTTAGVHALNTSLPKAFISIGP